jgi:nucleotide-binding universal stress UspA family protein
VAARAARHVAKLAAQLKAPPAVVLFHADEPLLNRVAVELGASRVAEYHAENSKFAMRNGRAALHRAGLAFEERSVVGEPAEAIVDYCRKSKCDLLVIGSHGRNAVKSLFLGSVTIKVLSHSQVPVTVIR